MKARVASRHFQSGEGPSRGLLRDCTTGCGTDGALHSTNPELGHGVAAQREPERGVDDGDVVVPALGLLVRHEVLVLAGEGDLEGEQELVRLHHVPPVVVLQKVATEGS